MGLLDYFRPKRPAIATDARATDSAPANPISSGSWWGIRSRLVNMMTGAGSATDKAMAWSWRVGGQLTQNDLQAMDRVGAYDQICGRLPNAALGQPPTVTYPDNADAAERLTDRAASLGLWGHAAWAAGRAQMDGVAGLLIVSDGVPTEPIDGDKVVRLHKLTRWEMRPEGWDTDIASPTFGSPLMVRIRTRIGGQRYERLVHRSRVVLFRGRKANGDDYSTQIGDGWDDYGWPLAVWIEEALRAMVIHGQEIPRQMATLNLLVHGLSLDGLDKELTADGQASTVEIYRQLRDRVSSAGVVGTAPGEKLERLESRLTGIAELTDGAFKQMSLATGEAGQSLTGMEPPGLGNGDKGLRMTLGVRTAAFAEAFLRLPLQYALTVLCAESSLDGTLVKMTFADPIPVTEAEWAALYEVTTRADIMLLQNQVLTADELRATRFNSGTWSASAAPIPERTVSDPTASAELRAAILGAVAPAQTPSEQTAAQPAQTEGAEGTADLPAEDPANAPKVEGEVVAPVVEEPKEPFPVGYITTALDIAKAVRAGEASPTQVRAILSGMMGVSPGVAEGIAPDQPESVVLPPPPTTANGDPVVVDPAQTAEDAEENYIPPEGAQGNAKKVLKWRDEHGDEVEGMTRVGWLRANQLAEGGPVSREVVGKMAGFERHRANYEAAAARVRSGESDPWTEPAYVAWLGWGGDTGIAWAQARIRGEDGTIDAALIALLPDVDAVKAIESVRQAVEEIVQDLAPETWPHLTLLYAGDIPLSRRAALRRGVVDRLPDLADDIDGDLTVKGLEVWPLPAEGRSVIVLRMGGGGLTRAHNALWAELTPIMTAKQHPNFKAHVTIGYVPGAVEPDTVAALQALSLPESLNMGQAVLKHGDAVRLTLPMTR